MMMRLFARTEAFILSLAAILLLAGSLGHTAPSNSSGAQTNLTKIRQDLAKIGPCVVKIVYSNIYPEAYLPTTVDQLKGACKNQTEGFKCLKEGIRPMPAIVKRGMQTLSQNRQRHHKKYCTNVNSEASGHFVNANKCIKEKKFPIYKAIDSKFANSLVAIHERNFNDSALELKYFCCAIINFRRASQDNAGPECESHKQLIEEMIMSIVPNDIGLLCDDDDASKVCPSLVPLRMSNASFVSKPGNEPSLLSLYLLATLGEPEVV